MVSLLNMVGVGSGVGLSLLMMVSSESLFFSWMGLEIGMFSALPLFFNEGDLDYKSGGGSIQLYFLVQVFSGLLLLMGFCSSVLSLSLVGLLFKLGLLPFFFWVPKVFEGVGWLGLFLVGRVLKMPGFLFLEMLMGASNCEWVWGLSLGGVVVGAMGMFSSMKNIKSLLGWSSLIDSSLIVLLFISGSPANWRYLCAYLMMFFIFCWSLEKIWRLKSSSLTLMVFLVIMGLPPFFGFFYKVILFSGVGGVVGGKKIVVAILSLILFFQGLGYYLALIEVWGYSFKSWGGVVGGLGLFLGGVGLWLVWSLM